MAFAKRPAPAPEATAATAAAPLKPVPVQPRSLLDDPDAVSPAGTILRLTGAIAAAFAVMAALALWLKPPEWWDDEDSSLSQPVYAHSRHAPKPPHLRSTFVRRNPV